MITQNVTTENITENSLINSAEIINRVFARRFDVIVSPADGYWKEWHDNYHKLEIAFVSPMFQGGARIAIFPQSTPIQEVCRTLWRWMAHDITCI